MMEQFDTLLEHPLSKVRKRMREVRATLQFDSSVQIAHAVPRSHVVASLAMMSEVSGQCEPFLDKGWQFSLAQGETGVWPPGRPHDDHYLLTLAVPVWAST